MAASDETRRKVAWEQLRRRKVVQWGLAYAALAWLALQILELVAESYEWPHATMRAGIGLAVTGLGIVIAVAWFHGDRGAQRVGTVEVTVLALVVLLGGAFVWWTLGGNGDARLAPSVPAAGPPLPADHRPSIAVLPFIDRTSGGEDAYFADGMHDDILTQLSRIGALRVISRSSVERFRKTDLSTREIAAQLGVATVLEGGVQRAGENVRISVQLIDARTDSQLWAESYDRQLNASNIFSIQSEVAESIAAALQASLTPEERARSKTVPTNDLEAWKYYQLGRQKLAERSIAGFADAERFFRKAIEIDPEFAPAYAGLSETLKIGEFYGGATDRESALEQAGQAAEQAMRLDPALADAWMAAGLVAQDRGQFPEAEASFRRAIELEPNNAMARKYYAALLIGTRGVDAGAAQMAVAAKLDPLSAIIQVNLGDVLATQGKRAEAEACFRRAIELDPAYANAYGAYSLFLSTSVDRYSEAEPLLRKVIELDPDNPRSELGLADYYLDLGDLQRFTAIIDGVARRWPDRIETDLARAWLATVTGDASAVKLHAGRAHERRPGNAEALAYLRNVYMREGRPEKALALYEERHSDLVQSRTPEVERGGDGLALDIAVLLQSMGQTQQAQALMARVAATLPDRPRVGMLFPYGIEDVVMYAASGDRQRALTALREAQKAGWHEGWLYFRDREPGLDSIRGDPEFKDVFARIEREMERQRKRVAAHG